MTGPERLVHVRTPVHEAWIDPLGGDIVKLKLPRFAKSVDDPETVTLFDRRPGHVYIAQSGLIGDDGRDRSGRPLYSVGANEYQIDEGELTVELRHEQDDVVVTKRFRFDADDYLMTVEQDIDNRSAATFGPRCSCR